PDGKPVVAAKVILVPATDIRQPVMSDAQGRFRFRCPKSAFPVRGDRRHVLAAFAAGRAAAIHLFAEYQTDGYTLRLPQDDPAIEGRVIDLEGRSVAGVEVRALSVRA